MLFAQKNFKCPRRFERPWNLTRVLWAPSQPMTHMLFFRWKSGSLKTQIPQIKISGEKQKKNFNGLAGAPRRRVPNFRAISKKQKNGVAHWMRIWGDMLEPACTRIVYIQYQGKYFAISCVRKAHPAIIHGSIYTCANYWLHHNQNTRQIYVGAWYNVRTTKTRVSCKINEYVRASVVSIEPL